VSYILILDHLSITQIEIDNQEVVQDCMRGPLNIAIGQKSVVAKVAGNDAPMEQAILGWRTKRRNQVTVWVWFLQRIRDKRKLRLKKVFNLFRF